MKIARLSLLLVVLLVFFMKTQAIENRITDPESFKFRMPIDTLGVLLKAGKNRKFMLPGFGWFKWSDVSTQ